MTAIMQFGIPSGGWLRWRAPNALMEIVEDPATKALIVELRAINHDLKTHTFTVKRNADLSIGFEGADSVRFAYARRVANGHEEVAGDKELWDQFDMVLLQQEPDHA